jgi:hypothetical protein
MSSLSRGLSLADLDQRIQEDLSNRCGEGVEAGREGVPNPRLRLLSADTENTPLNAV